MKFEFGTEVVTTLWGNPNCYRYNPNPSQKRINESIFQRIIFIAARLAFYLIFIISADCIRELVGSTSSSLTP